MRFRPLGFLLALLAGCTRPSVLVCREVVRDGVCRGPTRALEGGVEYRLLAVGVGLPDPDTRFVVRDASGRVIAERVIRSDGASFVDVPLRLHHRGRYRVTASEPGGGEFARTDIEVARSSVGPDAVHP